MRVDRGEIDWPGEERLSQHVSSDELSFPVKSPQKQKSEEETDIYKVTSKRQLNFSIHDMTVIHVVTRYPPIKKKTATERS